MNNIRKYRLKAGITQSELAEKIQKTTPCVSQYENGIHNPPIPVAKKIANVLRCKLNELFEEDG